MSKKENKRKKGFTIVETLVAIAILAIGVTAPITVIMSAIQASRAASDQVFAYYLAQEAIEYVRYARDTNIVNGAGWLNDFDECLESDDGFACGINDPRDTFNNSSDFVDCASVTCTVRYNAGQNVYSAQGGSATKYRLGILIDDTVNAREATVAVRVDWDSGGATRTYNLREQIFDWSGTP